MTRIILVEKNGTLKQLTAKELTEDILYKKCGLKKPNGFERRAAWPIGLAKGAMVGSIELWSKDIGRAGLENKYELPPPVDTPLYFGTMALVARDKDGELCDLEIASWEKLYNVLFGGFKDLDDSESEEEDELAIVPKSKKTKEGYLKDGFVVGDNSDDADDADADDADADDDDNDNDNEDIDDSEEQDAGCITAVDDIQDKLLNDSGSELEHDDYYYSDDEA